MMMMMVLWMLCSSDFVYYYEITEALVVVVVVVLWVNYWGLRRRGREEGGLGDLVHLLVCVCVWNW